MVGFLVLGGIAGLGFLIWLRQKNKSKGSNADLRDGEITTGRNPLPPVMPRSRPVQQFPTRRPWTRGEDLAVFYLQRLKAEGRLIHTHIEDLVASTGRTEASIRMRIGNFDALDPSVPSKGLSNAAQLTREIWSEYLCDPEQICAEAFRAYSSLIDRF